MDISGFSALTHALGQGPKGAMILSQCINDYLTLLITMVHECHGDIITFAGDAFLAFWQYDPSVADNSTPATPLLHAANCALKLQEKYNTYQVPGTSVILKIHIGIAYGSFYGMFPFWMFLAFFI